ncbi:YkgJ family cysteine cluster protein [bacterium]|nr:YkgJ family cysteine cluster protein [bacterium]MBU1074292.1 YkgJ family cysteine cluster protein [bacterium]MBU1674959.1 YkgJ family cysteine cluster protein [bacterium]
MTNTRKDFPDPAPGTQQSQVPDLLKDRRRLAAGETFSFGCHKGLACFTHCCADINILLTPVDVLRLARRLGIATGDFLDEHTQMPVTKDLHLPVVMLKMGAEPDRRCDFVGKDGCTIYEDRPWSCRMYPVGMAIPPARAGVEPEPVHFLFEDEICHGHGEPQTWTCESWKADQGLEEQEDLEAGFREIVSHPWFIGGTRQLDPKRMEMFYTACYDLDSFRRFIFDSTFTKRFELEDGLVEQLRTDDEALLRFAFRWLRYALFAEPTMTPTDSATQAATGATMERES